MVLAKIFQALAESSAWDIMLDLSFYKRSEQAQILFKPFGVVVFNNVAFSMERMERWDASISEFSLRKVVNDHENNGWYLFFTGPTWDSIAESLFPVLSFVFDAKRGHRFHFAYIEP